MKTSIFKRIAAAVTAAVLTASALPLDTAAEYVSYTLEQTEDGVLEVNGAVTSGDYKYNLLDDGTIEITDYIGSATDIVIPSEIDGYKVTVIDCNAFYYSAHYITSVTIPDGVTKIEAFVLFDCDSLTTITIPSSVTTIGEYAFAGCDSLTSINVDTGNRYYKIIDGVLFNIQATTLLCYPAGKTNSSYDIPDSVKTLGGSAFRDCDSLTSITIPNSVTTIGAYAFRHCTSLTSITIPNGVTTIRYMAFFDCYCLTSITIPNSVTTIGQYAFYACTHLTNITIPSSVTTIGSYAFQNCIRLTSITIPNSVTTIGSSTFEYCSITDVYYTGTEAEWAEIIIGSNNSDLTSATIHYNHVDGETSTDDNTADDENGTSTGLGNLISYPDHVLASAVYSYGSVNKNLINDHHKITFGDVVALDISTSFRIACSTKGDADKVSHYSLYCGSKVIKTTDDGLFNLKMSELTAGKDYYVVVTAKDGTYTKTPLMLEVGESSFTQPSEIKLGGSDGFELAINNEILGSMTLACDALKFPVQLVVTSDNKVRFGLNVKKDVLDDDSKFFDFKKQFEKAKKEIKNATNAASKDFSTIKKWLDMPNKNGKLISKDKSCNVTFAGYGEAALGEDGLTSISFVIIGSVEYSNGISRTFMVGPVPVVVSIDFKAGAELNAQLGYDFVKQDVFGDLDLGLKVAIEPFAGVGVGDYVGVGVTGKGELSVDIVLVSTSEPSGVEAVDLTAGLGIKAYLGPFEYKHTIAEKTWNLYSRGSTTTSAQTGELTVAPLYDSSSYKELSLREYKSEVVGTTAAANAEPAALIEDAYLAAAPKLAAVGDDIVMLYLDSDMERGTADQTVLKYMVYSGGAWSEPKQLDSNDTADWGADIYEINGDIWAIYQDAEEEFGDTVTTDQLADSFVIKAAQYDAESGSFGEPVSVSGSDGYNHSAAMGEVNGEPAAVWVNNTDTDFFGLNSTNSIMYSLCEQGTWSEPAEYLNGQNTVTGLAIGDVDGAMQIAYMTDGDNDLSTADDITLYTDGQTVSAGAISGLYIGELPSVSGDVICWYESGTLKYKGTAEIESLGEELGITSKYAVAGSSILYYGADAEDKSCVYMTSCNGSSWSAPVVIYRSDNEISHFAACGEMAVFMDTELTVADEDVTDSSVMKYFLYSEYTDAELIGTDLNYEDIIEGEDLPVTLTVENKGTSSINGLSVEIADEDGAVLETNVSTVIEMGEMAEIVVEMPVEKVDDREYTVTISAENDLNETNDSAELTLGRTELSVTSKEVVGGNNAYLVVDIHNESYIPAGCTLLLTNEEGKKLKRVLVENIDGKTTHQELFDISELLSAGKDTGIITVEVSTEKEEYYSFNNTIDQYIREIDGDIPYAIISFLDSDGSELTSAVYDIGDEIIAPALPSGSAGWMVYGDEAKQTVTEFGTAVRDMIYIAKDGAVPPQNIKAEAGDGKVTLSWDEVEGAEKYAVYIYENNEYTCLDSKITGTSYTASGLTNGTKYGFKLKAYAGAWSAASTMVYATPDVANIVPQNVKAAAGDGQATITWDEVAGATKYAVYIYENSKYVCLDSNIKGTSYTAAGLTNGTKYGFKVKAYVGKWSAASAIAYATPVGNIVPQNVKAVAGDGQATITWDAVNGATKYAVYIYENNEYTCLDSKITGTSYNATDLANGTKYGFKVKAYVGKWSAASAMAYATPVTADIVPQNVRAVAGNCEATVKWDAVAGATRYAVYIYIDGKYTCLDSNINTTSYTATDLTNGTKYGFKVKAYVGKWSAASKIAYTTPTTSTVPQGVKAVAGNGEVTVKWNEVAGAEKYAVYIYIDGKYTCITSEVTDLSYVVTNLTNGTKYGFKVKACVDGKWSAASLISYATPAE